jgi:hypothetical protein
MAVRPFSVEIDIGTDFPVIIGRGCHYAIKSPARFPNHQSLRVILAEKLKLVVEIDGGAHGTHGHREGQRN